MRALLFLVALSPAFAENNVQAKFDSIQARFSQGASAEVVVGVALAALVLIGILVFNEIRKSEARERVRAQISWEAFYARAKELGLLTNEIKLLENLVFRSRLGNADSILNSAQTFEKVRDEWYASKGGADAMSDDDLQMIRSLRARLRFSPLPVEIPYITTRQFSPGLRVMVEASPKGMTKAALVGDIDERRWSVDNPFMGDSAIQVGQTLRLSLTRGGDAEYGVEAEIDRLEGAFIILKHSQNLVRKQLRNWVRIDVNFAAVVRPMAKDGDKSIPSMAVKARVMDLSGGGMAIRLPFELEIGQRLHVDFQVLDTPMNGVEAEVIRVQQIPSHEQPIFQHSVSFKEIQKPFQEKIVRYVFEKQRQDAQWR